MGPGSDWNEPHVALKSSRSLGCWSIPSRLHGVLGWAFRKLSPVFILFSGPWGMWADSVPHGTVLPVCAGHAFGCRPSAFVPSPPIANSGMEGSLVFIHPAT